MFRSRSLRLAALSLLFWGLADLPAPAESKEMIQLQTQIQQLQDAVARLQQSNDERMGVLRDLVQQTADSVNRMSSTVTGLKADYATQQTAASGRKDELASQIQSLNDSLDELKARMQRMEKSLSAIQSQQQSANAMLTNLPQPGPSTGPAQPIASNADPSTAGPTGQPPASVGPANPPPADMYSAAYGDYMAAKYPLAASEFDSLIKAYPDDNLSGNASFYLGEINLKTGKPTAAVRFYDRVLEHYPDNSKIPVAHLHKADAMLSMKQNDGAVRELRTLIQRFPVSPEAAQARLRLTAMHVAAAPPAR
jgi:TolA-binding protein